MDPSEVRNERMAGNAGVAPAEEAAPGTTPLVGTRAPVAPAAAAPVAQEQRVYTTRVAVYPVGYRTIQLIWLIAGVVDIILALDFIFRAVNANNTGFAHYIYRLGGWLAAPFAGIFNSSTVANGTTVYRWSDVLAVVIYTVAAWILAKLVRIITTPRTGPVRG
ncbi:MAG: hypothetical protein ACRENL_02170 [Candidatus Dormibacteria bacterium]